MAILELVLSVISVVALLITLALALTLTVRSCEFSKQARAEVQVAQYTATPEVQKGQLVSVSNGVLFPLKSVSTLALVECEPPSKAQRLFRRCLVELVHDKFHNPQKGETGLRVCVRKFEAGLFVKARAHQIVPFTDHLEPNIVCTANHVVVYTQCAVAVFTCDFQTGDLKPCAWHTQASIEGRVSCANVSDEAVEFTMRNGSKTTVSKQGPQEHSVNKRAWVLKRTKTWRLHNNINETIELPQDTVCASLSASLLVWCCEKGGVWMRTLTDEGWSEALCLCPHTRVHKVTSNIDSKSVASFALELRDGGTAVGVLTTKKEKQDFQLLSLNQSLPNIDELSVLNPKMNCVLVALKTLKGVSLFGNIQRWLVQPNSDFLGLVVKRSKRSAFVVRKGQVELKDWMPSDLLRPGLLVHEGDALNVKSPNVSSGKVCAQVSGKTLEIL